MDTNMDINFKNGFEKQSGCGKKSVKDADKAKRQKFQEIQDDDDDGDGPELVSKSDKLGYF